MKRFKALTQKLRESKYGDAMSSRLPKHLDDPREKPKAPKKVKESTWESYRTKALEEAHLAEETEREQASHKDRIGSTLAANHSSVSDQTKKKAVPTWAPSWGQKAYDRASKHFAQTVKSKQMMKEDAPHPGHQMNFSDRMEHQYFGGEEARKDRDAYAKHLKSQGHKVKLGSNPNQLLHGVYGNVYTVSHKYPMKESVGSVPNAAFNESGPESYKVGDHVVPSIGPHKGQVHRVIHVHSTGHVNIAPELRPGSKNHYHLGAARAHPKDLEDAPGHGSKKLEEAVKPSGAYLKAKEKRKIHFANKGTIRVINRKTVREAFEAAKSKKKGENPFAKKDDKDTKLKPNDFQNSKDLKSPGQQDPQQADIQVKPAPFGSPNGAPVAPEKQSNAPKPEKKTDKLTVKGPGADDAFQTEPTVAGLTTLVKQ